MKDSRRTLSAHIARIVVATVAFITLCWLCLDRPGFYDHSIGGTTVDCAPIVKIGFGPVDDGIVATDSSTYDSLSEVISSATDNENAALVALATHSNAWTQRCEIARTDRMTEIFFTVLLFAGVFFTIRGKERIPLEPVERPRKRFENGRQPAAGWKYHV